MHRARSTEPCTRSTHTSQREREREKGREAVGIGSRSGHTSDHYHCLLPRTSRSSEESRRSSEQQPARQGEE